MSGKCPAITRSGKRCTLSVEGASGFCHLHDPARAGERKRNASRAGRSRPAGELGEVRDLLKAVTTMILNGEIETAPAAVLNQVLNTRVRLIEVTRRVQEQEELLARLSELEERAAVGGRRG